MTIPTQTTHFKNVNGQDYFYRLEGFKLQIWGNNNWIKCNDNGLSFKSLTAINQYNDVRRVFLDFNSARKRLEKTITRTKSALHGYSTIERC